MLQVRYVAGETNLHTALNTSNVSITREERTRHSHEVKKMATRNLSFALRAASALVSVCSCSQIYAQAPEVPTNVETINVNNARPIAATLLALQKKYGLPISYEDPEYSHPFDMKDVTESVRKDYFAMGGSAPRVVVPRGGPFKFQFAVKDDKPDEDTKILIRRMLAEYSAQGGQVFEIQERATEQHGTQWQIIPVRFRNPAGQFVDQPALLDNIISIPTGKMTGLGMLGRICDQLSQLSGRRVGIGTVPLNMLGNYQGEFEATNERARDVLADLLDKRFSGAPMVWELFYDPKGYALNIHIVANGSSPRNKGVGPVSMFASPSSIPNPSNPAKTRDQVRLPLRELYDRLHTPQGISAIQSALAREECYQGDPNGRDSKIIAAIQKFQSAHDLKPTGRPDPLTLARLGLVYDSTVPKL
jgi:hypothetical protein